MKLEEVHEHAEIVRNNVFHTYPFTKMLAGFNPDAPHAEDCGGCLINAEVDKLVEKLEKLSNPEKIVEELEHEKEERRLLTLDRWTAFEKAGLPEEGSVTDLVERLMHEHALDLKTLNEALEYEKEERRVLTLDRMRAFENAGVVDEGSVADLVERLVNQRDILLSVVRMIKRSINSIPREMRKA